MAYPIDQVHMFDIDPTELGEWCKKAQNMNPGDFKKMATQVADRQDTIAYGAMVMGILMEMGFAQNRIYETGLRAGLIYSCMPPEVQRQRPLIVDCETSDWRPAGVSKEQARDTATCLQNWLAPLTSLIDIDPTVIRAICLIHNCASRANKHTADEFAYSKVMEHGFLDIDHREKAFMALALYACQAGKIRKDHTISARAILEKSPDLIKGATLIGQLIKLAYGICNLSPEFEQTELRIKGSLSDLQWIKIFIDKDSDLAKLNFSHLKGGREDITKVAHCKTYIVDNEKLPARAPLNIHKLDIEPRQV